MLINFAILQWGTTWVACRRAARGTRSTGRGRQVARSPTACTRVTSTRSPGNRCSWSSTRTTASCSSKYRGTSGSRWWSWCRRRTRRRPCATPDTAEACSPCSSTPPSPPSALFATSVAWPCTTGSGASVTSSGSSSRPVSSSPDRSRCGKDSEQSYQFLRSTLRAVF